MLPFVGQARDVYYQGNLTPLNITPTFDKGYLAVYEPEHAVSLYRPDGSLAEKVTTQVPHAAWTNVVNASPDTDGSLALAVEYRIDHLGGGGVTVFDPTGSQTAFIDTSADYWPAQVCFGPDHSIWAIGWRRLNASAASNADYFVLRHYARNGQLLGAFLPRSSFVQEPVGNVVRRVDLPQKSIRAFPGDGSLYAIGYQNGYSVLDPAINSWRVISSFPNGILLGADGTQLVFLIETQTAWFGRRSNK